MMAAQIPLSLPVNTAMGEEDFLITSCNREAARQVDSFKGTLLLLGGKGAGKSHLARIWQKKNGAGPIGPETQDVPCIKGSLLWEDADQTRWNEILEKNAFHLLNSARENGANLLITATAPATTWVVRLPDLRSRLAALPVARLDSPDDELVAGLLLKHFRDRQLRVAEDLLNYLIPRLPREGATIGEAVRLLDESSLSRSRALTIPLAREALKNLVAFQQ